MEHDWPTVRGIVTRGHRVASGLADDSPYPGGTIAMQAPLFKARGLDLAGLFLGTLNISISPRTFAIAAPARTFRAVAWTDRHQPEDFSFANCALIAGGRRYPAWVYYPHPETKERHFQDPSIIEVIAPPIDGLGYGDSVALALDPAQIRVI